MREVRRRDALRTLAVIAMFPAIGLPSIGRSQTSKQTFSPPDTPMQFSRTLVRELVGGAQIVVTRRWRVLFESAGQGYVLRGEQTAVDVAVPPGLESLAGLERRKVEAGMFPIMLSSTGQIMSDNATVSKPAIDLAIDSAARKIASTGLSSDEQRAASQFLRMLQNSAQMATNRLPRDLFAPLQATRKQTRKLDLPGGGTGEIVIGFTAKTSEILGILSTAERVVTTRIGDSERVSIERWTLRAF